MINYTSSTLADYWDHRRTCRCLQQIRSRGVQTNVFPASHTAKRSWPPRLYPTVLSETVQHSRKLFWHSDHIICSCTTGCVPTDIQLKDTRTDQPRILFWHNLSSPIEAWKTNNRLNSLDDTTIPGRHPTTCRPAWPNSDSATWPADSETEYLLPALPLAWVSRTF